MRAAWKPTNCIRRFPPSTSALRGCSARLRPNRPYHVESECSLQPRRQGVVVIGRSLRGTCSTLQLSNCVCCTIRVGCLAWLLPVCSVGRGHGHLDVAPGVLFLARLLLEEFRCVSLVVKIHALRTTTWSEVLSTRLFRKDEALLQYELVQLSFTRQSRQD